MKYKYLDKILFTFSVPVTITPKNSNNILYTSIILVLFISSLFLGLITSCDYQSLEMQKFGCDDIKLIKGNIYSIYPSNVQIIMDRDYKWTYNEYKNGIENLSIAWQWIEVTYQNGNYKFDQDLFVSKDDLELFQPISLGYQNISIQLRANLNYIIEKRNLTILNNNDYDLFIRYYNKGHILVYNILGSSQQVTVNITEEEAGIISKPYYSMINPIKLSQTYTCHNCIYNESSFGFSNFLKTCTIMFTTFSTLYNVLNYIFSKFCIFENREENLKLLV